ncbi:MAG: aspartate-semialdehyde dehydrogenase, partial [Aminobacterium sp.]
MRIAVVGATGEVGRMMIKVLEEHKVQPDELRLFASARTAGMSLLFGGKSYTVEELTHDVLREGFDYVLFSAGSDVAKEYAPTAAEAGSVVIDNSSAFRRDATIPLIVPEINGDILEGYRGIVANPNCSTIQMVLGLYEIHRRFG